MLLVVSGTSYIPRQSLETQPYPTACRLGANMLVDVVKATAGQNLLLNRLPDKSSSVDQSQEIQNAIQEHAMKLVRCWLSLT